MEHLSKLRAPLTQAWVHLSFLAVFGGHEVVVQSHFDRGVRIFATHNRLRVQALLHKMEWGRGTGPWQHPPPPPPSPVKGSCLVAGGSLRN